MNGSRKSNKELPQFITKSFNLISLELAEYVFQLLNILHTRFELFDERGGIECKIHSNIL